MSDSTPGAISSTATGAPAGLRLLGFSIADGRTWSTAVQIIGAAAIRYACTNRQ